MRAYNLQNDGLGFLFLSAFAQAEKAEDKPSLTLRTFLCTHVTRPANQARASFSSTVKQVIPAPSE